MKLVIKVGEVLLIYNQCDLHIFIYTIIHSVSIYSSIYILNVWRIHIRRSHLRQLIDHANHIHP